MSDQSESISFRALESWGYPLRRIHQYSWVSDSDIESLMDSCELDDFQLASTWSALSSNSSTRSDNPIHAKIIAKMVQLFRDGRRVEPILIEASEDIRDGAMTRCAFCVKDGHHRLRALKYLGIEEFPAILEGQNTEALRELRELNGHV